MIELSSNTIVASVEIGTDSRGIALTPDGAFAYATSDVDQSQNSCGEGISVVNTSTRTLVNTIPLSFNPFGVAVSPSGALAYVGQGAANALKLIDTATRTIVGQITVGRYPNQIAFAPPLNVAIDIKPGEDPPSINPKSHGKVPVAILSSPTFDATTQVDRTSLTFGHTGDEQSLAFCNPGGEDVNGDGLPDLICHCETPKTGFQPGDTIGVLKGKTVTGIPIMGTDSIRIVP